MASRFAVALRKQLVSHRLSYSSRYFGSASEPSKIVEGLKAEDVASDPVMQAYFEANFPNKKANDNVDAQTGNDEEEDASPWTLEKMEKEKPITKELEDLNIRTLFGYKRSLQWEEGSEQCRRLRNQKQMIPGILYGSDPNLGIRSVDESSKILVKSPWHLLKRELNRYNRYIMNRVYDLTVYEDQDDEEGCVHRVIPSDFKWHPVKQQLYCANYLRYFPGRPIKIPIVYVNEEESRAMKAGGFIAPVARVVECNIEEGVPIPEHIELECTGLRLKDVVRMDRLIFPEGVKPSPRIKNPDMFLIGTVFGRRTLVGDDRNDAAESAEATEK
mmetsp:Transcript_7801/g.11205  ORF Transcript_7801/g.11205 Transcript_7801/m.11205 type:complete len:330 (-) Transcript_7801:39-1028(-)